MAEWKKITTNYILRPDESDLADIFFISWQPNQNVVPFIPSFDAETDRGETALVITLDSYVYLILNGDFRKDYEGLMPDLDACLAFYQANEKEHGSSWSTI